MKNLKKILAAAVALALVVVSVAACSATPTPAPSAAPATSAPAATTAPAASASAAASGQVTIAFISKGFQFQYWQTVMKGAQAAADKYNVKMTFNGPDSESNISQQVDMLNAAIDTKPAALCLAALDTNSVTTQLTQCKTNNIPVIGFDSGVPNAPAGTVLATASTDNAKAGALGADSMFADPTFLAALKAGTTDNPVIIGVQSQDATSASIVGRTQGFLDEMVKNCETVLPGQVAVTGHDKYKKDATSGKAAVELYVMVPPSTSATDESNATTQLLGMKGLIAIFASNQGSADGVLAATNDGSDLDRTNGKYKNITVVGFDAGKGQKAAVKAGDFLGSITQDPYQIGFDALEMAYNAVQGKTVSDVDTGAKFYNAANMGNADIAQLLYD